MQFYGRFLEHKAAVLRPSSLRSLTGIKLGYNFNEGKNPLQYPIHGPFPLG